MPSVLFTILLFSTPGTISGTAKIVFIFVMYNLYALAYTALGCAMSTLNVRLTRNEKEINTISTLIMFGSILGNTLINAVAISVLTALSGGSNQYTRTAFIEFAVILGVICLVGTLLTYFTTTEIKDTEDTQDGQKNRVLIRKKYSCSFEKQILDHAAYKYSMCLPGALYKTCGYDLLWNVCAR